MVSLEVACVQPFICFAALCFAADFCFGNFLGYGLLFASSILTVAIACSPLVINNIFVKRVRFPISSFKTFQAISRFAADRFIDRDFILKKFGFNCVGIAFYVLGFFYTMQRAYSLRCASIVLR